MGIFKTRELTQDELRRAELQEAIVEVRRELDVARNGFQNASEPELVDAAAFQIKSLEARYSYLLRVAREEGCDSFSVFKTLR